MRVMGPSKVHSVRGEAGASSGWNIAVDHKPPPMGRFLFFVDSSRKSSFHLFEFLRIRGGEVVRLTPVLVEVVEFPLVRQRRPFLDAFRHAAHPRFTRAGGAGEPAVVVDAAAGHDVEELRLPRSRRFGIAKRIDHADAVDRILLEPVHDLRRRDLRQFVDRRHDVDDVMELRPRRRVALMRFGQETAIGWRVPPKWSPTSLVDL